MRVAAVVPAYDVAARVGEVVAGLRAIWPDPTAVFVVDDGSHDGTGRAATEAGAQVVRHRSNLGKGRAIQTGLELVRERGFDTMVTVDGDGQHPPVEALAMHRRCADPGAFVLGVRDLRRAGAPRANQWSNAFSNLVISSFTGLGLADTQCGLRRYPVAETLALGSQESGYGFEAEVLIRAAARDARIVQIPIAVVYPPPAERISHFHSVRDPTRIVLRVVRTVASTRAERLRWRLAGG